jgi:long-subunit acyl-CoA synthetase (AMP-forming)
MKSAFMVSTQGDTRMKKNAPLYEVRPITDLRDMLAQSGKLYADRTAFLIKDRRGGPYLPVTYRQYAGDVDAFGTALADLGLKGGRIAILAEARYEWYVSYLAAVNGTGIVVPLDKELPVGEIHSLLERSRADAIIYSSTKKEQIDLIRADNPGVRYFICMDATDQAIPGCGHRSGRDEYPPVHFRHHRDVQGCHALPCQYLCQPRGHVLDALYRAGGCLSLRIASAPHL